jgi:hypothetical protein
MNFICFLRLAAVEINLTAKLSVPAWQQVKEIKKIDRIFMHKYNVIKETENINGLSYEGLAGGIKVSAIQGWVR